MLNNYFSEIILGLQDAIIKKVEENEKGVTITIRIKRKSHKCPICGSQTDRIHDYRKQELKDLPLFGKPYKIILEKRRYACSCGKHFTEKVPFLPRYHRMTKRLICHVIDSLSDVRSFKSVANEHNISVSTVIRIFDHITFKTPDMPRVIAIDEFKGNTGGEKYNCILTDPCEHKVIDILPKRYASYLSTYFRSKKDRENVEVFISDMWKPYADTASVYFKNAKQVVDKYHWIRQVIWAFERVRKDVQKQFQKDYRTYFKHSKTLLTKRYDFLEDHQKQQVMVMLSVSPTLYSAHFMKEQFLKILDCKDRVSAKSALYDWIDNALDSTIPAFAACAKTMLAWRTGILNSFDTTYTNGYTEGCNNKIKVLKRNAYGYRNFTRFRKRILHIFA